MQVRISKPAKSSMQSARGKDEWLLEFVQTPGSKSKESLMGRVSSSDMSNEVKLFFPSLESAEAFAKKKQYSYEIIEPKKETIVKKNYASNFM